MMLRVAITLAILWLAQAASAETVLVRTAEHDGFTRVVVDFTERPAWTLGRVGDAYELRTEGAEISYDLSDIYRRIYRRRLVSIEPAAPGDLRLVTGCECSLKTALRRNGGLIIDIAEIPPTADNIHEASLPDRQAPAAPPAAPRLTLPLSIPPVAPDVLPLLADDSIQQAAVDLGKSLARQIGRAAELDLVDLAAGVRADDLAGQAPSP